MPCYLHGQGELPERDLMAGRQLRGVGGEEAAKAFVKAGGLRRAGKGDHVNIKMPNGQAHYDTVSQGAKNRVT